MELYYRRGMLIGRFQRSFCFNGLNAHIHVLAGVRDKGGCENHIL